MTPEQVQTLIEEWCASTDCGIDIGITLSRFGTKSGASGSLYKFLAEKATVAIAAERPVWTSETPTAPGYYWFLRAGIGEPFVVRIERQGLGLTVYDDRAEPRELSEFLKYSASPQWSGPLEEPK